MISGRLELKITDYGLAELRRDSFQDSFALATLKKQCPSLVDQGKRKKHNVEPVPRLFLANSEDILFLAPETVQNLVGAYVSFPTKAADVYSVGIVMSEITSCTRPYWELIEENFDYDAIFDKVRLEKIRPKLAQPSTEEEDYIFRINDIISECLRDDPNERPGLSALEVICIHS